MNNFATNEQRKMRDTVLLPWYRRIAFEGRFVLCDGTGTLAQRMFQMEAGVDTILQIKRYNNWISIQEMIVQFPRSGRAYTKIFLETDSCTIPGHETPGWMHYGYADRLLYCMETAEHDLDCLDIAFSELRAWFWPRVESFDTFRMPEENRGAGRLVPIEDIKGGVPKERFRLPHQPASAAAADNFDFDRLPFEDDSP